MKLKFLLPLALPIITIPAITLISCSSSDLSQEQINEEKFLVSQAAKNKFSPKVELKSNINISQVDSKIINFDKIDKEDKILNYEILNFEIPLVGTNDTNVNVKVSSKLDSEISETYSFKVSDAIIKNGFTISEMSNQDFQSAVIDIYFKNDNFLTNLTNDISVRISQAGNQLDISLKKYDQNNVLKSILDIPNEKIIFINNIENYIKLTVINQMNEIALQRNLAIKVNDVTRKVSAINEAEIMIDIIFDNNSIYSLPTFSTSSFSTNYFNLDEELKVLLTQKFKPTILNATLINPIPIYELYEYLSIDFSQDQYLNNDFMIDINTNYPLPTPPTASEDSEIEIEISSSNFSDRINGKYRIKIKELINYGPNVIDFNAIQSPLPLPFFENNSNIKRVIKWK
ncbi:MAG: hypothetical protein ACRC7B_00665 [Metamycoplasmataceae bacterium]